MGIPQDSNTKVTEDMGHGLFQHTLHIPHLSASDGYIFCSVRELVEGHYVEQRVGELCSEFAEDGSEMLCRRI
jgi:hypothetical protein